MLLSSLFLSMIMTFVPTQHQTQPTSQPVNPWAAGNAALQRVVDYVEAYEHAKAAEYWQEVHDANQEEEVAQTVVNTDTPTTDDEFLACTRAHESDTAGGYGAVSPGGMYRGAYQFDQSTWDSTAASSGRPDLVGVDPATVSAQDQDTLATNLYHARGNQPWGGRC